jgi:hypothetical protein
MMDKTHDTDELGCDEAERLFERLEKCLPSTDEQRDRLDRVAS